MRGPPCADWQEAFTGTGRRNTPANPDRALVREMRTGRLIDTLATDPSPAVGPRLTVAVSNDELVATDARTGDVRWTATPRVPDDAYHPPLQLGRHAWTGSRDGVLVAHPVRTGRRVYSRRLIPEEARLTDPGLALRCGRHARRADAGTDLRVPRLREGLTSRRHRPLRSRRVRI
jgi:hypothetical protein